MDNRITTKKWWVCLILTGVLVCCGAEIDKPASSIPFANPSPTPVLVNETPLLPDSLSENEAVVASLNDSARPLNTIQPGSGYEDLEAFESLVSDARVVSLGEATHGSHEFFTMKDRLVRYLVEQHGFTVIAIEALWPELQRVDEYVTGYDINLDDALSDLNYPSVRTQEFRTLVEWVRTYNMTVPSEHQVRIGGIDLGSPDLLSDRLLAFIATVDQQAIETFKIYFDTIEQSGQLESNQQQRLDTAIAIYNALETHRADYISASSVAEFDQAWHGARVLVQTYTEDVSRTQNKLSMRDRFMAENARWLMEHAGQDAKMVVWAHNNHVGYEPYTGQQSLGSHLRDRYNDEIVTIGFGFATGTFNAKNQNGDWVIQTVPDPISSMAAATLRKLRPPLLFLSFRDLHPDAPATSWLMKPLQIWGIGAGFDSDSPFLSLSTFVLPRQFDGFIFVKYSSPSAIIPQKSLRAIRGG